MTVKKEQLEKVKLLLQALIRSYISHIQSAKTHLKSISRQLEMLHPSKAIATYRVQVSELEEMLERALVHQLEAKKTLLCYTKAAIHSHSPKEWLIQKKTQLITCRAALHGYLRKVFSTQHERLSQIRGYLTEKIAWQLAFKKKLFQTTLSKNSPNLLISKKFVLLHEHLRHISSHLEACNPTLPLAKGFVLVKDKQDHVCTSIHSIEIQEKVVLIFSDGTADATVMNKRVSDTL